MARYIDADDLKAVVKANDWSNPVVPDVVGVIIDRTPTADVAPRAEVEALIKENERWMTEYANYREGVRETINEIKSDVAMEIFEEIENHLIFNHYGIAVISDKTYAELKKKYTEG